ncbi:hypothetical protein F5876DRAFT_69954 [Lentinula aff. lateritia]|uniref:Uncharacterized protein n=1 Tax=Lentinula aff. lateritia TaxID=2804960 RepID=A0ACC1TKX2_9AGAR|nr:hypothetical protein F5876DRAFT_69954 [Lentinula aff. lateritia]
MQDDRDPEPRSPLNKHAKLAHNASAHQTLRALARQDTHRKRPHNPEHEIPVSPTSPTVMRQRREALYPYNKPPPKLDLFSFNEDEDGTLAETIGNLHGCLDFSGPAKKGIREMFNMTFLYDGCFRHAIFYPSDLMQGLSDGKAKMILAGKDRWVAIIFFNGGNTMHQKIKLKANPAEEDQAEAVMEEAMKLQDNNMVFSNLLAPLSKTAGSMQHKVHSFVSSMDIIPTGFTAPRKGRNTSVWVLYAAPFAKGDSYKGVDDNEKTVRRYIASLIYKFINIEENISIDCWGEQTKCSLCKLMEHHFFS